MARAIVGMFEPISPNFYPPLHDFLTKINLILGATSRSGNAHYVTAIVNSDPIIQRLIIKIIKMKILKKDFRLIESEFEQERFRNDFNGRCIKSMLLLDTTQINMVYNEDDERERQKEKADAKKCTYYVATASASPSISAQMIQDTCAHPEYSFKDRRMQSFKNKEQYFKVCIDENKNFIEHMADAGLFYTGEIDDDCVECFYCGRGICDFEKGDVPLHLKLKWHGKCKYMQYLEENVDVPLTEANLNDITDIANKFKSLVKDTTAVDKPKTQKTQPLKTTKSDSNASNTNSPHIQKTVTKTQEDKDKLSNVQAKFKAKTLHMSDIGMFADNEDFEGPELSYDFIKDSDTVPLAYNDIVYATVNWFPYKSQLVEFFNRETDNNPTSSLCKLCNKNESCILYFPCAHEVTCLKCGTSYRTCCVCDEPVSGSICLNTPN